MGCHLHVSPSEARFKLRPCCIMRNISDASCADAPLLAGARANNGAGAEMLPEHDVLHCSRGIQSIDSLEQWWWARHKHILPPSSLSAAPPPPWQCPLKFDSHSLQPHVLLGHFGVKPLLVTLRLKHFSGLLGRSAASLPLVLLPPHGQRRLLFQLGQNCFCGCPFLLYFAWPTPSISFMATTAFSSQPPSVLIKRYDN